MKKSKKYVEKKPCFIVGFPIISKLIRGHTVELSDVCFIPDSQLHNESKNMYACVDFTEPQTEQGEPNLNDTPDKEKDGTDEKK